MEIYIPTILSQKDHAVWRYLDLKLTGFTDFSISMLI